MTLYCSKQISVRYLILLTLNGGIFALILIEYCRRNVLAEIVNIWKIGDNNIPDGRGYVHIIVIYSK